MKKNILYKNFKYMIKNSIIIYILFNMVRLTKKKGLKFFYDNFRLIWMNYMRSIIKTYIA